jgi:hypothetical protein
MSDSRAFQAFALFVSLMVIGINLYFFTDYVTTELGTAWYILLAMIPATVIYFLFVCYLVRCE